jgi:hypothetical protein
MTVNVNEWSIALLSQEGSVIAKQSHEGWFQSRTFAGCRSGTTPALRATPPDSGGEFPLTYS